MAGGPSPYEERVRELAEARAELDRLRHDVMEAIRPSFIDCPDHELITVDCDNCWANAGEAEMADRVRLALADKRVYGAFARAEALAAGREDWMTVTEWSG